MIETIIDIPTRDGLMETFICRPERGVASTNAPPLPTPHARVHKTVSIATLKRSAPTNCGCQTSRM